MFTHDPIYRNVDPSFLSYGGGKLKWLFEPFCSWQEPPSLNYCHPPNNSLRIELVNRNPQESLDYLGK